MGDLDTDPKMMRTQQNEDAPETIETDETAKAALRPNDVDAVSQTERERAKAGNVADGRDQMDVVFEANRRAVSSDESDARTARTPEDRREAERQSLAQPGRSRLGS
ncbi:hypothetical protein [Aureimonas pseudogalii]|uniref:Uncharacterized protein n=1 Tax=Aureimonas pseudogalii TaxID=1744844 RepID=A0A7W6ED45_9HYPH|nr:hypothetical protein [Aureimonas pseudogalii]MBB3996465.1 hypothetical protein [Aureimonas pseudogalii]